MMNPNTHKTEVPGSSPGWPTKVAIPSQDEDLENLAMHFKKRRSASKGG